MFRKLKTIGPAILAIFAMSAFLAPAAQAQFTASSYPTTAVANSAIGNDDFKTEAGSVECAADFVGTLTEASNTLTLEPTYTNCKAFGFTEASMNMNGCAYVFHRWSLLISHVTIECSGGKILIKAGNCEVQIGEQGPLSSISLSNNGNHIQVAFNLANIAYAVTKDGFLCPFGGTGNKTGGTYTQNESVTLYPITGGYQVSVE
jgi:hypothetical protein